MGREVDDLAHVSADWARVSADGAPVASSCNGTSRGTLTRGAFLHFSTGFVGSAFSSSDGTIPADGRVARTGFHGGRVLQYCQSNMTFFSEPVKGRRI